MEQMEKVAKAMGMNVDEYQLGMNARMRLENNLSSQRLNGGSGGITVERDVKFPPAFLEFTITAEGKAKAKEAVQKHLAEVMKKASEAAEKGRSEAQKSMMALISGQLKLKKVSSKLNIVVLGVRFLGFCHCDTCIRATRYPVLHTRLERIL
jgi:ribosomal protein L35